MPLSALEALQIESACQRLIYLAAACIDGNEFSAFCGLFTSDGILERPDGSVLSGPPAILAAYQARPAHRMSLHVISNTRFTDVSENACRATSLVTLWASDSSNENGSHGRAVEQALVLGEFDDSFSLVDGAWRIARRRARFLMHAAKPAPMA